MEAFPLYEPFALGNSSTVHIFGRHVQRLELPSSAADVEGLNQRFKAISNIHPAPDASCTFTAKVI
jgi:hypothetical protein